MPIQLKKTALGIYKVSQAYVKGVKGGLNEVGKILEEGAQKLNKVGKARGRIPAGLGSAGC